MAKDISLMERDELIHEVLICNDRLLTFMGEHLRLSSEVKKLEEENNALQLEIEKLRSENDRLKFRSLGFTASLAMINDEPIDGYDKLVGALFSIDNRENVK